MPEIAAILGDESEEMTALRQATPFAGVLEPAERWAVYARRTSCGNSMTRADLEHIIRAAGTVADVTDIVVIGSQAVLGEFPEAPEEFLVRMRRTCSPVSIPNVAT